MIIEYYLKQLTKHFLIHICIQVLHQSEVVILHDEEINTVSGHISYHITIHKEMF